MSGSNMPPVSRQKAMASVSSSNSSGETETVRPEREERRLTSLSGLNLLKRASYSSIRRRSRSPMCGATGEYTSVSVPRARN